MSVEIVVKGAAESDCRMRSIIGWIGGKSLLAPTIIALFPEHDCYVEVFGGAASVLLTKEPAGNEVYNDLDGDLVNLFLCAREHPDELCRQVEHLVSSRRVFEEFKQQRGMTDIQRAARFLYLARMSFNSLGNVFAYSKSRGRRAFFPERVRAAVGEVQDRMQRATIEQDDFGAILQRYDGARTLFYLDPPYVIGHKGLYRMPFTMADHERLCEALGRVRGRWVLSYGDHPWVRQACRRWHCYAVEFDYSAPVGADRVAGKELVITNYRPTRAQLRAAPKTLTRIPRRRKGGSKGTG